MMRIALGCAIAIVCVSVSSATVIDFSGWSASNLRVELLVDGSGNNYGSRIASSSVTYTGSGTNTASFIKGRGWTPHVRLNWVKSGNNKFDTYKNWDGRGDVAQVESDDAACEIVFVPDADYKIIINSFVLDEWGGGGNMTCNWSLVSSFGVITNGVWSRTNSGRDTILTGLSSADMVEGNAVTLRFERVSGDTYYLAMDDLDFHEEYRDILPENAATGLLLSETWDNSGGHTSLPHTNWPGWFVGAAGPEVNGSDWWTPGYFAAGSYPTDVGFLDQSVQTVTKELSGTFVEGKLYSLKFDVFSAGNYSKSRDANLFWRGTLLADGVPVAYDNWFSEEFSGLAGIPTNRIITVDSSHDGLTECVIRYKATAADAGKIIGVQLSGPTFNAGGKLADGYYAWYDNISLTVTKPVGAVMIVR